MEKGIIFIINCGIQWGSLLPKSEICISSYLRFGCQGGLKSTDYGCTFLIRDIDHNIASILAKIEVIVFIKILISKILFPFFCVHDSYIYF